jgi:hypothetical protein
MGFGSTIGIKAIVLIVEKVSNLVTPPPFTEKGILFKKTLSMERFNK